MKFALCLFSVFFLSMRSTSAQEEYRLPTKAIVDVIDASPEPGVSPSHDGRWLLLVDRQAMPSIADLSRRMLGLAGMRIDPAADGPFRTDFSSGLAIQSTSTDSKPIRVDLPADARIANVSWSHKNDCIAFSLVTDSGTDLYIVRLSEPGKAIRLLTGISTVHGFIDWHPDGKSFLCRVIPEGRGAEPEAPVVPKGPNVQQSEGNISPTRTFQDLLTSPYDDSLFEFFSTSQLVEVLLDGSKKPVGKPCMLLGSSWSPDGKHVLVTSMQRPFSRLMTMDSFPQTVEVWNRQGKSISQVVKTPMAENIPIEGVVTWRRNISWRPDMPSTLTWNEALDGGDPRAKVPARDKMMMLASPFDGEPTELCRIEHRSFGASWTSEPVRMMCTEFDRDRRWVRINIYDPSDFSKPPTTFMDRSVRDRYGDPGTPVSVLNDFGFPVVAKKDNWIWMDGKGASPDGDLPFLDRVNIETLKTERIWRCEQGVYESIMDIIFGENGEPQSFITQFESQLLPPNCRRRGMDGNVQFAMTDFADPTPQIRGIQKQLITYDRGDGVQLSATMYLPPDWKPGKRLPMLVWAYPVEFNDAATAGQITTSPSRFVRISGLSHLALVLEGYAVMDNATMPVIGDPETMNDTFIEQIVAAAQAAIDKAVDMGVADRDRVAVGGHSYGAFMTANLLAHCKLFRAGVARSGAYNRTLTPFGFQSERRPYWEARDVYEKVSPFTWANQIQDPLLLVHGENDNNPGTFPIQSERMYQAVKGYGGTVRLVMLPKESHGYRARESVLHTHAETLDWLNRFVRDASPRNPVPAAPASQIQN